MISCDKNESTQMAEIKVIEHIVNSRQSDNTCNDEDELEALKKENESLKEKIQQLKSRGKFTFQDIKHSDALVKVYTGCPNCAIFLFYC